MIRCHCRNEIYLFNRLSSCIVGWYIIVQLASPVIFQGDWIILFCHQSPIIFYHQSPRPFSFHMAGDNTYIVHFWMYICTLLQSAVHKLHSDHPGLLTQILTYICTPFWVCYRHKMTTKNVSNLIACHHGFSHFQVAGYGTNIDACTPPCYGPGSDKGNEIQYHLLCVHT